LGVVLWEENFFLFGADKFAFEIPFKKCFKIIVLELQFV